MSDPSETSKSFEDQLQASWTSARAARARERAQQRLRELERQRAASQSPATQSPAATPGGQPQATSRSVGASPAFPTGPPLHESTGIRTPRPARPTRPARPGPTPGRVCVCVCVCVCEGEGYSRREGCTAGRTPGVRECDGGSALLKRN